MSDSATTRPLGKPSKPAAIPQSVLDALPAKHGDLELHLITTESGHQVVVSAPSRVQWKRFRDAGHNERKRPGALEDLFRDCCVYPEPTELDALLLRRPALAETFGDALLEIAGAEDRRGTEKKAL